MSFSLVYVTFPNEKNAKSLASQIIELKLAAGANLFPINSTFWWQNAIQQEGEWAALFQTTTEGLSSLKHFVLEHHPYKVPCFIYYPVQANESYEEWVQNEVNG